MCSDRLCREVQAAVERARRAQPAWAALPLAERAARLRAAIQRLKEGEAELAELITREMGKARPGALVFFFAFHVSGCVAFTPVYYE